MEKQTQSNPILSAVALAKADSKWRKPCLTVGTLTQGSPKNALLVAVTASAKSAKSIPFNSAIKAVAQIEKGEFESTGEKIETIEKLEFYKNGREGIVVRIDRFGNIITNLPRQQKNKYCVETTEKKWIRQAHHIKYTMNLYANYEAAKDGELFLIEGSSNTLEISLKNGNANEQLCMKTGERIRIS